MPNENEILSGRGASGGKYFSFSEGMKFVLKILNDFWTLGLNIYVTDSK